jgi:hypothetical protein
LPSFSDNEGVETKFKMPYTLRLAPRAKYNVMVRVYIGKRQNKIEANIVASNSKDSYRCC